MPGADRQRVRLGGLWTRRAQSGLEVLSGSLPAMRLKDALREAADWNVPDLQLVVFQNTYKAKLSDPDYIAYLEPHRRPDRPDREA